MYKRKIIVEPGKFPIVELTNKQRSKMEVGPEEFVQLRSAEVCVSDDGHKFFSFGEMYASTDPSLDPREWERIGHGLSTTNEQSSQLLSLYPTLKKAWDRGVDTTLQLWEDLEEWGCTDVLKKQINVMYV